MVEYCIVCLTVTCRETFCLQPFALCGVVGSAIVTLEYKSPEKCSPYIDVIVWQLSRHDRYRREPKLTVAVTCQVLGSSFRVNSPPTLSLCLQNSGQFLRRGNHFLEVKKTRALNLCHCFTKDLTTPQSHNLFQVYMMIFFSALMHKLLQNFVLKHLWEMNVY